MTIFAKYISETEISYPDYFKYPFKNVPNVLTNESLHRKFNYVPLVCGHVPEDGFSLTYKKFRYVNQTSIKIVKTDVNPETGEKIIKDVIDPKTGNIIAKVPHMIEIEKEFDASYIEVIEWEEIQIPADPIADEMLRLKIAKEESEFAIVLLICRLASKYDALEDIAAMEDITIPNLQKLAEAKNVSSSDMMETMMGIQLQVLQLQAVSGGTWADCWKALKDKFQELFGIQLTFC